MSRLHFFSSNSTSVGMSFYCRLLGMTILIIGMRTFAAKIRSIVSSKKNSPLPSDSIPFDFVKSRKGILKELTFSKQAGNLIGVYSTMLGSGMFLTVVEDIEALGKDEVIVFHGYDMSGQKLRRTKLLIDEIQMVLPFNKLYKRPVVWTEKTEKDQ